MSQPSTSFSVPQTPATTTCSDIERIFDAALKSYKKKTKKDLKSHDLFKQLETCDSPTAILTLFQATQFEIGGDDRLKRWLVPTLNVLCAFSNTLGEGISLAFPPAKAVFAGVGVLLSAAKDVAESRDILIDIFGRIESFFVRLEIYAKVSLTPAMTNKMVQITVEVLDILATATKQMKQSAAKKFLKRVVGRTDLEDGLVKLDKLINEEVAMASAQLLKIAHNIDNNVTEVNEGVSRVDENVLVVKSEVQLVNDNVKAVDDKMQIVADDGEVTAKTVKAILQQTIDGAENVKLVNDNVKAVDDRVKTIADDCKATANEVKVILQQTADGIDNIKGNQLLECLRKWQSPPNPSTNHNIAGDRQHQGTAEWFIESTKFHKWKVTGPLLWIHGKPGSGKSVLCSAIINDIATLCEVRSASMAYFYFDFRDFDKQSRRNLLPSLLVQLSTRSDAFCDIFYRLYETHDNGARQPSDKALTECLKEMLTLPNQGPVYLIMDALDECPDTSDVPSAREQVLDTIKDLVGLQLPSLRICVTSRPECDIGDALGSLASQTVSLQDERGQKKDIADYVRSVIYSGSGNFMRRWRNEDKEHVIETLSGRADGMFRWVFCQLEMLRNCLPQNVRRVLRELPNSLDETYERILREILKANPEQAYRLLQCLTVATRPLRVDELAEILALDFDGGKEGIPLLNKDWRWDDEEQGVLSTCSSLIVVVDGYVGPSKTRVVQFAHFSVKEFLTSDRLSDIKADISCFHIRPEPAHTVIAQACLAILLQLDCNDKAKSGSPLSHYAARYWVDHAQFGSVSSRVEDGTRLLFDPAKPYFTAWLNSYNLDHIWRSFPQGDVSVPIRLTSTFTSSGEADAPLCLYYAALCGFYDVTKDLIATHPHHVNARVGLNRSPLVAALCNRHVHVAELLRQHGAVLCTSYGGRTLLHAASKDGVINVARWLLNIGADANAQQDDHRTPLHLAAANGHLEIVQTLLGHGVDVNAAASWNNRTPLHEASSAGHVDIVRLLSQNGAAASTDLQGLLHSASLLRARSAETVQLFIQLGVDVNAQDGSHATPLHLASSAGNAETVRLLIKHGVDVNTRDGSQSMPLHLALSKGHDETVRMLIHNGADVNARDGNRSTPLHQALSWGGTGTALLLINHGAYVNALDGGHSTPLHLASSRGDAEVVQILIQNGADVNARDGNHSTPLHLASLEGNCDTVRILIEHGADVHALDQSQSTPLHNASSLSSWSNAETNVRLLIEHGANVNAYDTNHQTPLHLVSSSWSPNINSLCLLLENGADADAEDDKGLTPFQIASSEGNNETAQLLLDHCK